MFLPMVFVLVDCHLLSIVVDFILLFSVYIVFYFELADDTYSVRVPCTNPYLYFLLCSFVKCSKCTINFDSPWTLISLQHIRVHGELLFSSSCWILSFTSWCLWISDMDHLFAYFCFLNTLRLGNLRIDVLDVMTSRFLG